MFQVTGYRYECVASDGVMRVGRCVADDFYTVAASWCAEIMVAYI